MPSIKVELSTLVIQRLKENSFGRRTLVEEAVRMLRYALKHMFPPQTPDDWKNLVGREEWAELIQLWMGKSKPNADHEVPLNQPYELVLEVPSDIASKIEELARSQQLGMSEAAAYTIQYALTEVFPPRTAEELTEEVAESWRAIFRAIWKR